MPVLWSIIAASSFRTAPTIKSLISNKTILPSLLFFIVVCSYKEWAGGWTFGPRYLMPVFVLILFSQIQKIKLDTYKKLWFWIPVTFGLTYAFLAKFTVIYSIPSKFHFPIVQVIIPKLQQGSFNDGNLLSMIFNVDPKFAPFAFILIFTLGFILLYRKSVSAT